MLVLCRFKEYLVVFVMMMMIIIMNCFRRMVDKAVTEAATRGVQLEKVFLEILQNSQECIYSRVSFLKKLQAEAFRVFFIKKETLAQVFSCEFCDISKNTFLHRTPPVGGCFYCYILFSLGIVN